MAPSNDSTITYRKITRSSAGQYEVLHGGERIGTVGRFRMSAGQFGSRWMATTPSGKRLTTFMTRDAATGWLVRQART